MLSSQHKPYYPIVLHQENNVYLIHFLPKSIYQFDDHLESGLGLSIIPQPTLLNDQSTVQVLPFYPAESRAIVLVSISHKGLALAAKACIIISLNQSNDGQKKIIQSLMLQRRLLIICSLLWISV